MSRSAFLARLVASGTVSIALGLGSAAAATLQVSAGILTGAKSVLVSGLAYDVEFVEGTCASVFSGCDSLSDFPFGSTAAANAAVQALLDQVFIDGTAGNFDTDPSKTFGCAGGTLNRCFVMTPATFGTSNNVNAPTATNNVAESGDSPAGSVVSLTFDSSGSGQHVWARWTRSQTLQPLPEPGTLALLAAAALALTATRRGGSATARGR